MADNASSAVRPRSTTASARRATTSPPRPASAVLSSAGGLLSLSASNRLARVVDRTRVLAREYELLAMGPRSPVTEAREGLVVRQMRIDGRTWTFRDEDGYPVWMHGAP